MEFELHCSGFRTGTLTDLHLTAEDYARDLARALQGILQERAVDPRRATHPLSKPTLAVTGRISKRRRRGAGAGAGIRTGADHGAGASAGAS
jgi:hypothetical protein